MKFFKAIHAYLKILFLLLLRKKVNQKDYKFEYNDAAQTYEIWLKVMSKFAEDIIRLDLLANKENIKILDFACGTGFISKTICKNLKNTAFDITAVDISEKMIQKARNSITDKKCVFTVQDGIEFLQNEKPLKFDAIYCGFALPYFKHKLLIKQFTRVLKKNGTIHLITNCKGTLKGINKIIIEAMIENPSYIKKTIDIYLGLPKNEKAINSWFKKSQYETLHLNTINEILYFATPRELYDWLHMTGAIAGISSTFTNYEEIEKIIVDKIDKQLWSDGRYKINHKFIQAIFRKK